MMHGQFVRDTERVIDKKKSRFWLKQGDLKKGAEALIMAGQEQAIRTNYIKHNIDKTRDSPMCRVHGKKGKAINHIICECSNLAKKNIRDVMTM